jgi:serine/threonine protein kinase
VPAPLADGERILARYQILTSLGRGEIADTYEAHDATSGSSVVLRLFGQLRDPDALRTFDRQAREAERMAPSFVAHRELLQSDRGPMLVSAHLGPSVGTATRSSPPSLLVALATLTTLSKLIKQLHDAGFAHGGIHPHNLFAPSPAQLQLTDLGMLDLRRASGVTQPAPFGWLAPEILGGGAASSEADLYSAALVAFYLGTGVHVFHAFDAPSRDATALWNEMHGPLDLVGRSRMGKRPISADVAQALEALLSPDPQRRPRDLSGVLSSFSAGGPDWKKGGGPSGTLMMSGGAEALWGGKSAGAAQPAPAPAQPPMAPAPAQPPMAPAYSASGYGPPPAQPPTAPSPAGASAASLPPAMIHTNPFARPSENAMPAAVQPPPMQTAPKGDANAVRMIPENTRIRTVLALQDEFPDFLASVAAKPGIPASPTPAAGAPPPAVPGPGPGVGAGAPHPGAAPPPMVSRAAEKDEPAPPPLVAGGAPAPVDKEPAVTDFSTTFYVAAAREDLMRPTDYASLRQDDVPPSMNDELRQAIDVRQKKMPTQTIVLIVAGVVLAIAAVCVILWLLLRVDDSSKFPTSSLPAPHVTEIAQVFSVFPGRG